MKIVIDIPETMLDWLKNGYPNEDDMDNLIELVLNGTPLDDIKAEIKSLIERCDTDYEFEEILAYKTVLEIIDKHIGKEKE